MVKVTATNYPVGDFLIKIKNASMAGKKEARVAQSAKILAVAEALKKLGYLDGVKKDKDGITVSLAFKNKKPVLMDVKLMSKPGLRIYMGVPEIEKKKGPSIYLISSPSGIISSRQAVKNRCGGEVIAEIL
jgi:small subunit ribosomal protein S8